MSISETIGIVGAILAFLLAPLLGLVAWTFTTFRSEANRAIELLRAENREQALQLAALKASGHDERMIQLLDGLGRGLEKLDDKLDGLGRGFDRFATIVERMDRRLGLSGGEYRAVKAGP